MDKMCRLAAVWAGELAVLPGLFPPFWFLVGVPFGGVIGGAFLSELGGFLSDPNEAELELPEEGGESNFNPLPSELELSLPESPLPS
jgi:hypothetical protein